MSRLWTLHIGALLALVLTPAFLAGGCGGGGGGSASAGTSSFQVAALSVANGSVWQINREIVLGFTEPVDFSTVSANTIHIGSTDEVPATGTFVLRDPRTVVFQPSCPTRDDLSDAGFSPNGVTYVLRVVGRDSSTNTLRSVDGVALGTQQVRTFSTPASTQIAIAFQDTVPGPPVPVLRAQGSTQSAATFVETGDDPATRVYFELDPNQRPVLSDPTFESPLNLYADQASRVAFVIAFNQPVNPSASNISESRLRLEYEDASGAWHAIKTRVTLEANCSETGSRVRLEPTGVLPPASRVRAVVRAGFQDLVGEASFQELSTFAQLSTRSVSFASLNPADLLSDALNDSFDFPAPSPLSNEDETALFDTPTADWGGGVLSAAFAFDGSGGPNADFDWVVHSGEHFFFDTTSTPIIGGPNGVPTTTLTAVNGVVDVRNFVIQPGGEVRVQGPNPMRINATGEVRIEGELDLSGFGAKDVVGLNTTNLMELGGAGAAGGGKGGNANENTSAATTRGGRGSGPFRQAGLGAEGGEMGISAAAGGANSKDQRRPGGGAGGRFAKDWPASTPPLEMSLVAGAGHDGHPLSRGAESGVSPAKGGQPNAGPFLDPSDDNDFFGVEPRTSAGELVGLIRGELPSLWGGYGGGGGGNASLIYPQPVWSSNGDEKGGGGGGAAGGLHIKALGPIVFAGAGVIKANGAQGGTGEHTFLDHIGGTGGGGSGGHIVLESASFVDFTGVGNGQGAPIVERIDACGPQLKTGSLGHVNACCYALSNGGPGGAGVIQLHVPNSVAPPSDTRSGGDVVVPTDALALALPLDAVTSPPAYVMIPSFGARSKARSNWISIGGADQKADGSEGLVRFLFDGIVTDPGPDQGKIRTQGSTVTEARELLTVANLATSNVARILPDGITMEITGGALIGIRASRTSGISNDVYLRTPALFEGCAIRLVLVNSPVIFEDFEIVHGEYDEGGPAQGDEALRLSVSTARPLTAFNDGLGAVGMRLLPRFFHVVTSGQSQLLPATASVRVRFQAAADNGIGGPNEAAPLVDWTSDISAFNALPPGALQFFRYEVEFDLDAAAQGVTADTAPVTLEFLKIPFVF